VDPAKDDIRSWGKPAGIYTLVRKLKEQKVFRFIGVTTHVSAAAMKETLEMYEFDTVLTTFNPTKERRDYESLVLPVVQKQNLGLVAMKIMGGATRYNMTSLEGFPAKLVGAEDGKAPADQLLRYVLSLPIHTATSGVSSYAQLRQNLEVCYNFKPMEDRQRRALQVALHDSDRFLAYNKPDYAWA
jgi:predicted aldo/keto reductase-like oxidoreductase